MSMKAKAERHETVVAFERVSKCYTPQAGRFLNSWRRRRGASRGHASDESAFWAVKDLSFSVRRGETVGIIGDNGAGKSTILKLMAGITVPSEGRVTVQGRISSLIELGAGFNPDLTGHENIYLNGAVQGLSRSEIDGCIDAIEAFSGLGSFLNVPVKYYSSGMYARLGFAIAAHVEADVIVTDEILAVGDAAFQRQCLKKFKELQTASTIIFVSHDLVRVKEVCARALWIKQGRLHQAGEAGAVVESYLQVAQVERDRQLRATAGPTQEGEVRRGTGEVEIVDVTTWNGKGEPQAVFREDDVLVVRIAYRLRSACSDPGFCVNIMSDGGAFVHGTNTFIHGMTLDLARDAGTIEVRYPTVPLVPGVYRLTVGVTSDNNWAVPYDFREQVTQIEVLGTRRDGGIVVLDHQWSRPAECGS